MKTRTKIIIPAAVFLATGLLYLFAVAGGYPPYFEGMRLTLYSDHSVQGIEIHPDYPPTVITDKDLEGAPELKGLIHEALSKEYPLNTEGSVLVSFEDLDNFQHQYAEILAEKYSKNSTDFFTIEDGLVPEKYLAIDPTAHRRMFDGRYFEYNGEHYGIGPDGLYIPNMKEDGDFIRLHAYKARGPLQGNDNVWADLSEKRMDIMPLIRLAIDDIGQHQESIKVRTSGLSPATMSKYLNWQANTLEGHLFEYKGRIFSLGFWIA